MSRGAFQPGISVIVPSYQGCQRLPDMVASLLEQTLAPELFEVIVVLNGPADGSYEVLAQARAEHPGLNLRVLTSDAPGASRARNLGLAAVRREYVTFLDDDDRLEPRFLEVGLATAGPGVCALLPIVDVRAGQREESTSLGVRIKALAGTTQLARSTPWALGFNACKVVPSAVLTRYRYAENLVSGEDVVFFAHLLKYPDLALRVPQEHAGAAYLRTQRAGSVSRQESSYQFSVRQRLDCIASLRGIAVPEASATARESLEAAQFSFVRDYLKTNPTDVDSAIAEAVSLKVPGLPWAELRTEKARRLVISYCFPPYADTAANVVAKHIAARGELVDAISADMSRVRGKDPSTQLIIESYLAQHAEIRVDPSFAAWPLISSFARKAARVAGKRMNSAEPYEAMYSRALWSGSHVAAALVKLKHPGLSWEAEFSDPLRFGVDGQPREGAITPGLTTLQLRRAVSSSRWPGIPLDTHFALTEAVTLIYADRLVFTNANQREVMLAPYPERLQEEARAKSVIRPHTPPPRELFSLGTSRARAVPGKINIAYFGNFYANRGMGPVLQALSTLPDKERQRFVLHIYCGNPAAVDALRWRQAAEAPGAPVDVRAYPYADYLDFLATTEDYDVLLVNDAETTGSAFTVNPFLPSKYSDYSASTTPVWGIVAADSPLSGLPLDYRSQSGDTDAIVKTLYHLLREVD